MVGCLLSAILSGVPLRFSLFCVVAGTKLYRIFIGIWILGKNLAKVGQEKKEVCRRTCHILILIYTAVAIYLLYFKTYKLAFFSFVNSSIFLMRKN